MYACVDLLSLASVSQFGTKGSTVWKERFTHWFHARVMSSTTKFFSLIIVLRCYGTQIKYKCFRPALTTTDMTIRKVLKNSSIRPVALPHTTFLKETTHFFFLKLWHSSFRSLKPSESTECFGLSVFQHCRVLSTRKAEVFCCWNVTQ